MADGWNQGSQVMFGQRQPNGFETIAGAATAKGLTPPAKTKLAIIQAVGQNVRWRDDGTDPDATTGMQLVAGSSLVYVGDLTTIKFFEEAATVEINVSYYV